MVNKSKSTLMLVAGSTFTLIITMSVPSQQTASQTEFQDAMANLNVQFNATILCVRVVHNTARIINHIQA